MRSTRFATVAGCLMLIVCAMTRTAPAAPFNMADDGTIVACNSDLGVIIADPAYTVFNVIDGQNAAPGNDAGTIGEVFHDGSYYLGADPSGYFILDLGSAQPVYAIDLFNTNNGTVNDRRTGAYSITASNSISAGTFTTITLSGSITNLASGSLVPDSSPLDPQAATLSTQQYFRYLRFDITQGAGTFGPGLNEVRVFNPEPSTALVLVAGCVALARRRRLARSM